MVNKFVPAKAGASPKVGLFVTCLVDLIRPSVGFAAVKLLEDAGCQVFVPGQTCCGQPAYNSGDRATTKDIARQTIAAFEDCDYIVAPSGSCAGMLAKHYPELFADEPELARKANAFARQMFRARQLPRRRDESRRSVGAIRWRGRLSRFLLGPARTRRRGATAQIAGERRRPAPRRR